MIFKVVDVLGLDKRFLRTFAHHLDYDVGNGGEGRVGLGRGEHLRQLLTADRGVFHLFRQFNGRLSSQRYQSQV